MDRRRVGDLAGPGGRAAPASIGRARARSAESRAVIVGLPRLGRFGRTVARRSACQESGAGGRTQGAGETPLPGRGAAGILGVAAKPPTPGPPLARSPPCPTRPEHEGSPIGRDPRPLARRPRPGPGRCRRAGPGGRRVLRAEDPAGPGRAVLLLPLEGVEGRPGRAPARQPRGPARRGRQRAGGRAGEGRREPPDRQPPPRVDQDAAEGGPAPRRGDRRLRPLGRSGCAGPPRRVGRPGAGVGSGEGEGRALGLPAPRSPPIPEVRDKAWPRSPIDSFVLARLEAKGLAPPRRSAGSPGSGGSTST